MRKEELEKENADLKARLNAINLLTPELEKTVEVEKATALQSKRNHLFGFACNRNKWKMQSSVY